MKAIKILFLSVFLIFLVNTASAVVVYGEWSDNYAQSISIEDGDSVDFSAFFGTISPPMTISIKLYDSSNNLIHTFEDTVVNQRSFAQTYIVNQDIYSGPGDFQIRILGSDNFGEMSAVLYLDVINYPPVITSTPITEVNENDPYEYQVEAVDPDNHVLSYSLVAPAWLSINQGSGLITGTAPDVSADTNFEISVTVSDGIDTDTQSYVLKVIWIPNPSLSQTVELVDEINIEYHASFSELDSAILKIYYKEFGSLDDYGLIITIDITAPPYTETFSYESHGITKGDYRFILEAVGYDLNKINDIDIPDCAPIVDSIPDENFNEEDTIVINLPVPTDKNPEDNPVAYLSAISDGKTNAFLDSENYLLTLEGNRDQTGYYQVELEFGDPDGETATAILNGYIYNLPDISGVLENNEDDTGIQGIIRVYYINPDNLSDYLPLEIDKIYEGSIVDADLGKIETTSNGIFDFQINEKASDLDEIILQARIGSSEDYIGYVRTIELSGDDNSDILVRAVPYAPYEDDPVLFRQFMYEIGGSPPDTRFDFYAEYIKDGEFDPEAWPDLVNYTGLIGIEILSENPFGAENGTFTTEQQNNIKNKILDLNDISGIIGNYGISEEQVSIINGSEGHFDFYEYHIPPKGRVLANPGWIIVVPYSNMPYSGLAEPRKAGTLVYGGTIYLRLTGNKTISHEFGHIFIASGHPITLSDQSVMSGTSILQTTGPADKKAGKLIYEQTFMTFPLAVFPEVDYLYNILGLGFYGENQTTGTTIGNPFEAEDDDDNFIGGQQDSDEGSVEDSVIGFGDSGSSNGVNANIPYDGTIHLQSNTDKNNIITSLSNIIRQVISFISQKLRSVFSI